MGYGPETVRELEQTINAACRDSGGAEFVIVGTPIDLGRFLRLDRPALRARYSVEEVGRPTLAEVLRERLLGDLRLAGRPRRDG
jgi:predicted GTPase